MQQTMINGYRVMIFTGFDGTQLFVNNPAGDNIYAHRVSGDALARAKEIIALDTPEIEPTVENAPMLNLGTRRGEFIEAVQRGQNFDLTVYNDFERDSFVVVNRDKGTEYRVNLENRDGSLHAACGCGDFIYRKRVCKHISSVLMDALFIARV